MNSCTVHSVSPRYGQAESSPASCIPLVAAIRPLLADVGFGDPMLVSGTESGHSPMAVGDGTLGPTPAGDSVAAKDLLQGPMTLPHARPGRDTDGPCLSRRSDTGRHL